ncbi:MAG: hypothetical protein LBT09_07070 [Planctomycetaceae bacterium]|nr:hypothetical protein [Planctomycetaceae bacterium]
MDRSRPDCIFRLGDPFNFNLSQPVFNLNNSQPARPFGKRIAHLTRLRRD